MKMKRILVEWFSTIFLLWCFFRFSDPLGTLDQSQWSGTSSVARIQLESHCISQARFQAAAFSYRPSIRTDGQGERWPSLCWASCFSPASFCVFLVAMFAGWIWRLFAFISYWVIFTRIRSSRVVVGHVCRQKQHHFESKFKFYELSLLGSRLPMKLMLEAKEWYGSRIVKASSFVGATILSATMDIVINIRVCYTSTFSHLKENTCVLQFFAPTLHFCYVSLNTRVKESDCFNYSFSCHIRYHVTMHDWCF